MSTMTDATVAHVTADDVNLIESAHDALDQAMQGQAEPHDLWRLTRELDAMLHRWRAEQTRVRS